MVDLSTGQTIAGTLLAFTVSTSAAGLGLGGGPLFLVVYGLMLGLDVKVAVALSNASVFGVALGSILILLSSYHPTEKKRPLIDFYTAAVLEPATLAGATIGVLLNKVSPMWVTTVTLFPSMCLISRQVFIKAMDLYRKETDQQNAGALTTTITVDNQENEEMESLDGEDDSTLLRTSNNQAKFAKFMERRFPWQPILLIGMTWVGLVSIDYIKTYNKEVSDCKHYLYWLVVGGSMLYFVLITYLWVSHVRASFADRVQSGYVPIEGEVHWDQVHNCVVGPLMSILAGLLSGFLGIGGGVVKGPLMLSMKMQPQVAAATASFMIVFTVSATNIEYMLQHLIPYGTALWFMSTCFVGAVIGQYIVKSLVRKYQRQSFISFGMGLLIFFSGLSMTIDLIIRTYNKAHQDKGSTAFRSAC